MRHDVCGTIVAHPGRARSLAVGWTMSSTLATIGIHHPALRDGAIAIGERLQVLADYPTPPNCTSPFAPLWIAEMVRRQG